MSGRADLVVVSGGSRAQTKSAVECRGSSCGLLPPLRSCVLSPAPLKIVCVLPQKYSKVCSSYFADGLGSVYMYIRAFFFFILSSACGASWGFSMPLFAITWSVFARQRWCVAIAIYEA